MRQSWSADELSCRFSCLRRKYKEWIEISEELNKILKKTNKVFFKEKENERCKFIANKKEDI